MTLYIKETLEDGATVIGDNSSGEDKAVAVLKPGQAEQVLAVPYGNDGSAQRARLTAFIEENGKQWAQDNADRLAASGGLEPIDNVPTTAHDSEQAPS